MSTFEIIEKKLHDALSPTLLEITDESHKHAGHTGWRPHCVTHIHIKISSHAFLDKSKVSIHKMIYKALDRELKNGLHAVSITYIKE